MPFLTETSEDEGMPLAGTPEKPPSRSGCSVSSKKTGGGGRSKRARKDYLPPAVAEGDS